MNGEAIEASGAVGAAERVARFVHGAELARDYLDQNPDADQLQAARDYYFENFESFIPRSYSAELEPQDEATATADGAFLRLEVEIVARQYARVYQEIYMPEAIEQGRRRSRLTGEIISRVYDHLGIEPTPHALDTHIKQAVSKQVDDWWQENEDNFGVDRLSEPEKHSLRRDRKYRIYDAMQPLATFVDYTTRAGEAITSAFLAINPFDTSYYPRQARVAVAQQLRTQMSRIGNEQQLQAVLVSLVEPYWNHMAREGLLEWPDAQVETAANTIAQIFSTAAIRAATLEYLVSDQEQEIFQSQLYDMRQAARHRRRS